MSYFRFIFPVTIIQLLQENRLDLDSIGFDVTARRTVGSKSAKKGQT